MTIDAAIERLYDLRVGKKGSAGVPPASSKGSCGQDGHAPLASGNDVSFIDAAHLIPFAESRNDHPTNGLALCKNHHWAMDRDLIAPRPGIAGGDAGPFWHVSKLLDPRTRPGIARGGAGRSNGEKELVALSGQSVLLPKDPAFHPDAEGLRWRCERLSA